MGLKFSEAQRALVSDAVTQAERATDGEIVTIVADASDAYHDVVLHYAIGAMLLTAGGFALFPQVLEAKLALLHYGWMAETELPQALLLLMVAQALVFLIVRYLVGLSWLRILLTPGATKTRRVRHRALQYFRSSAEKRTQNRVGILLYVSLAEHRAEIIADEAIHSLVPNEHWGEAMAALVDGFRARNPAEGMAAAVGKIGVVLKQHFPKTESDTNELPDRLIEL